MKKLCLCGCGKEFEYNINSKRRYIQGHQLLGKVSSKKGKTFEEIYGIEKAKELKQIISKTGLGRSTGTLEERFGKKKAQEIKEKMSKKSIGRNKGKKFGTLEERFGKKKAQQIKEKLSNASKGTYEEKFGKEKALIIRRKQSQSSKGKNSGTLEERFGKKKAQQIKEKFSIIHKGITYEERFGKERAKNIKDKKNKSMLGKNKDKYKGMTYEEKFGKERAQQIKDRIIKKRIKWSREKIINMYLKLGNIKQADWNLYSKLKILPNSCTLRRIFGSFQNLEEISGKKFIPSNKYERVGSNEKQILDIIEKEKNIKLERQFKVAGKFVDGYNPITNTVYEIYEHYHYQGVQPIKDKIREEKIKQELNCDFKIINEQEFFNNINQSTLEDF